MNSPVNILLVDDEPRNLDVLESILQSPDYRLFRTQRAEDALIALLETEFAAIVLDIQMPGMSGIEMANLVKQRRRTQHIPIIFLTAYFQEDKDVLQGYEVGAVDYLTKPINPQILKSKVAVFVDLFRMTRALTASNVALAQEVAERQKAEESLRQANSELEARVRVRTADLVRANAGLTASEDRYRGLVQALPAAVYTCDAQGRIQLYNKAAVALWGKEPELGKDSWCGSYRIYRTDGTVLPLEDCPMAVTLKGGRPVRGEEVVVERPDGTRRHVLPYPDPIRDSSGAIVGAVNMLVDITERKQAEAAARESETRFRNMADNAPVLIWIADRTKACTWFNQRWLDFVGRPLEKEVGDLWLENVHPEDSDRRLKTFFESFDARRAFEMEYRLRRQDGEFRWVFDHGIPLYDPSREFTGYIGSCIDITERKRAQETLRASEARLAAASRAKDDFLATLSHELRTPLSPVLLLASESAANLELPAHIRADFDTIRKNVELEARLIDDLLDLTRIARGKLALDLRSQDVHSILQDSIRNVRADLDEKRIYLSLNLAAHPSTVLGDNVRLHQIFWNVLRNAVKFTPEAGKITVETRVAESNTKLAVEISDTGIGMTEEEISRVFQAFSQGDHAENGGTHRFGGIGLGLAISRMLVELQSGSIQAASAGPGLGSRFLIHLPIFQTVERDGNSVSRRALPSCGPEGRQAEPPGLRRILLVEDHEPTRDTLADLLRRRRFEVITAGSVAEAWRHAEQEDFDLLISDIGLPDGNGYDLMIKLRHRRGLKGIALTGYGMERDIARSREAGFVAHLTKPVHVQSLESALAAAATASP